MIAGLETLPFEPKTAPNRSMATRAVPLLAILLIQLGCLPRSESDVKTTNGPEISRPEDTPHEPDLWAPAADFPPYIFGVAGSGIPADPVRLLILHQTAASNGPERQVVRTPAGQPAEFEISLQDDTGRSLLNPIAMLAAKDPSRGEIQRVFVIFASRRGAEFEHALGEFLVNLTELKSGNVTVAPGRVFNLPVRGPLNGINLSRGASDSRLTVTVPAVAGDQSQPLVLVYDIGADAAMRDPVDILMVPRN